MQREAREEETNNMLEALSATLCTTTICFRRMEGPPSNEELYHEPIGSRQKSNVTDKDDDASSYSSYGQGLSALYSAKSNVPSVIRMDSPVIHPSTPTRDSVASTDRNKTHRHLMLPSAYECPTTTATTSNPSHLQQQQQQALEKEQRKKSIDETDHETVSTQSSYSLSVSSRANDIESPTGRGVRRRSTAQKALLKQPMHWNVTVTEDADGFKIHGPPPELVVAAPSPKPIHWNVTVTEDTDGGFKIHGPPELMGFAIEEIGDGEFGTPSQPKESKSTKNNKTFKLRLRTSRGDAGSLYLPALE